MFIKNVCCLNDSRADILCPSLPEDVDGASLLALPAITGTWVDGKCEPFAVESLISRGISTVLYSNDKHSPITTVSQLLEKHLILGKLFVGNKVRIKHRLFFCGSSENLSEIELIRHYRNLCCGIELFVEEGLSSRMMDRIFHFAAEEEIEVALRLDFFMEGRRIQVEEQLEKKAVEESLEFSAKHGTVLRISGVRSFEGLKLIRSAKNSGIRIIMEVHLSCFFLRSSGRILVDSQDLCLEFSEEENFFWEAVMDGTVDSISTIAFLGGSKDLDAKFYIPFMMHVVSQKIMPLDRIKQLLFNQVSAFQTPISKDDFILVDPSLKGNFARKEFSSEYERKFLAGRSFSGWPVFIVIDGVAYGIHNHGSEVFLGCHNS
ncbi:hypothetical protein [Chlamydiifrater volucris]|uniref:hypothetical protein n=1 Tax=Chlamydiifrater volucris TaxID=2681470 RepID=UPI001BD066EE|nr:hypothetical protein [Chlamydiifrater volucris]